MNAQLEKAILARDLDAVVRLVETEKADWQEGGQQALYLAAKKGARDIVRYFLKELLRPHAVQTARKKVIQAGEYIEDAELDECLKDVIETHVMHGGKNIDEAVNNGGTALISQAIKLGAHGLFRFLAEQDPNAIIEHGPAIARGYDAFSFVLPIARLGADISFANGKLFLQAVAEGDVECARGMIEKGVNVNETDKGRLSHPLEAAVWLGGRETREEMVSALLDGGADIRAHMAFSVRKMVLSKNPRVFEFTGRAETGSLLPLLVSIDNEVGHNGRFSEFISSRYPFVRKWEERDAMRLFLANGFLPAPNHWSEKFGRIDEDDGFLLKCAVASARATQLVEYFLAQGAHPNAKTDAPLRLAVVLEKRELIVPLVQAGADLYAGGNAVFREALRTGSVLMQDELAAAVSLQAELCKKSFRARFDMGVTPDGLRGGGGLLLAARAGLFADYVRAGVIYGLTAADFLTPDTGGATLAGILAARREWDTIFDKKIWSGSSEDVRRVWDSLSAPEQAQAQASYLKIQRGFMVEENQRALRQKNRSYKL